MNEDGRILTPAEAWPHVPPLVAARFASKVLIGTCDECGWTNRGRRAHGLLARLRHGFPDRELAALVAGSA